MKKEITKTLVKVVSLGFTFGGVVLLFFDVTDGLLMMILGELVDRPYRIRDKFKE